METLDEIWAGDLFDRRREADDLIGYLESVAGRPPTREDGHAHVMAVDTAYGHGKTFFLRRFNRHLKSTDHVSAFVDAWVDDLEDQPIVALAATLDRALAPWAAKSEEVATGLAEFKSKAGQVVKIVGVGLAKRGAGYLITQGAVEALGDELGRESKVSRDITRDALKEGGKAVVDDVMAAFKTITPSMDARIVQFQEGQAAIQAMKNSLAHVVQSLVAAGLKLPITIIVDELDRCRPTYAIKVLEEIKHLFDVQGVAFLLGLHGRQLEHSITAAYGVGFDGAAYLRRFFNRRYSLKPVSLEPLIQHLLTTLSVNEPRLSHPAVIRAGAGKAVEMPAAELISGYLQAYGLAARDTFEIVEGIHTALALTSGNKIQLSYALPLIISRHLGHETLVSPLSNPPWTIAFFNDPFGRDVKEYTLQVYLPELDAATKLTDVQLSEKVNNGDRMARIVADYGFQNSSNSYHLLQNYPELTRAVARFS